MAKPMLAIDVDVMPAPALIVGGFYRAASSFKDFREPIEHSIREVILPSINNNFEVEGIPTWQPLSELTYERRKYPSKPILQQTGTLKLMATSIKPWTINDNDAYLLSSNLGEAFYGAIHESGSIWMVSRPWSTIQTQDEEKIEEIFRDHSLGRVLKYSVVGNLIGGAIRRFFRR